MIIDKEVFLLKRQLGLVLGLLLILLIAACGSSNQDQDSAKEMVSETFSDNHGLSDTESYSDSDSDNEMADDQLTTSNEVDNNASNNTTERMIIHKADLYINVKDLAKTQLVLEEKTQQYGGYIVESNVNRIEDKYMSGKMIIRIPEKHFQTFLTDTEEIAAEVVERFITGQDVTEEHVDLSSRLKSKEVVEERLISFLGDAKKTEDLLTISADLAIIQEEIELIIGKMNYLENQASFSTIEISMSEEKVVVPEIDSSKLDTWEKTKKQLTTSVNVILSAGSGLIIFFVGNLPIIGLIILVGVIIFMIIRRQLKR